MQIDDFKRVVETFSDPGTELLSEKGKIVFSMDGRTISATIRQKNGDISISEEGDEQETPASLWIIKRLARLPLLANRLVELIPQQENFVPPSASLLPSLASVSEGIESKTENALNTLLDNLDDKSPLETTVLYITSDAGEGKTYLINEAARVQAKKFTAGKSDWLLVPISLGGRHFLRFDDITVGALQNKYRFSSLYYNSFLALVRMGVIVPAFDGFEEMFVENSSGEALSAMGILVGALNSTGTVVVAARKAYFEFENLKSQEKLYDSINNYSVGFSKLELIRWDKNQFLSYCGKRSIPKANEMYGKVSERLGANHSLLTRPVLVRRLVDVAEKSPSLDSFLEQIGASGTDYFSVFVRSIVEREAIDKWVDRSGEMGIPLLSIDEHCELLSQIAVNMWESRVDYIKRDILDVVVDLFCEEKRKSPFQLQQTRERIRGHALLVVSQNVPQSVEFDHEEFRFFFLGEGLAEIAKTLSKVAKFDVLSILKKGILPKHTRLIFIQSIKRQPEIDRLNVAKFLIEIAKLDGQASYTQQNCGDLIIQLISEIDADNLLIEGLAFGADSMRDCKLKNITFRNCYFAQMNLDGTTLDECHFNNCRFGQISTFKSTKITLSTFEESEIDSLWVETTSMGIELWNPADIRHHLTTIGLIFNLESKSAISETNLSLEIDDALVSVEKLLRYFMRSTHISESVIKIKLGDHGQMFIDNELPHLLEVSVLCEIKDRSGKNQRRFKLGMPLEKINTCFSSAQGSYPRFLEHCKSKKSQNQ